MRNSCAQLQSILSPLAHMSSVSHHYSHTHKAVSWSPFSSHPTEKILFNHHQWRKRVERSGTEEQKNKPSTKLPSENGDQTYLSCRKTAAPPKRLLSPCLWPGLWAATCTCQSPGAPYLERDIWLLTVGVTNNQIIALFEKRRVQRCDLTFSTQQHRVSEGTG